VRYESVARIRHRTFDTVTMISNDDTGKQLRALYELEGGVRSVFSSKVADYAASRPDYPAALFETLRAYCPPGPDVTVADIGAGTGLLTRGLLKAGYQVVAVEPNLKMLAVADSEFAEVDGYSSVEGSAESIPLKAATIDLVTAAQAFHWFDVERARNEFLRVLTSLGQVGLVSNDRVLEDPLHSALDEISGEFGGAKRTAMLAHEDRSDVPRFFGSTRPSEFCWPHEQCLSEEALLSLVFSRSYIPDRSTRDGHEVADRVRSLFSRFAIGGTVIVRYRTVAIIGRPA
jgi:SAM-dependent methyltransferase